MNKPSNEQVEMLKIDLENDRLLLDKAKFEFEKRKSIWTALSVIFPAVAVAATIIWGIIEARDQAHLTSDLAAEQANLEFRLEAAKTVMDRDSYGDQISQASFLRENFPTQLGENFFPKLDIHKYPDARNVGAKWNFARYIASTGLTPAEALKLYHLLYPLDDSWSYGEGIRHLLDEATDRQSARAKK